MKILIDGQTLSTPEVNRGIGTYLLKTIEYMVASGMGPRLVLATYDDYDRQSVSAFGDSITRTSLGPRLSFEPGAENAYEDRLIRLVREQDIDLLWIPNCLMLNVHALHVKPPCKTVLTVYDLIPLVYKDLFFSRIWSEAATNRYLRRLADLGQVYDHIIAISDSTRLDLTRLTSARPDAVHTIYLGHKQSRQALMSREKIQGRYGVKDYIFYVGGFDPRKNMHNSVLAFKMLVDCHDLPDLHFLITCAYDPQSGAQFGEFLEKNTLQGRVKLTGYVDDDELLALYKYAKVFFFPSLYEGFGLPLLEAMAMGIPIAASNCSSVPEVVGTSAVLFDPARIEEMAEALYQIVADPDLAARLGQNGIREAKNFSWKRCADETARLFKEIFVRSIEEQLQGRSLKIAYFSPLPPQQSGIAVYSEELLPHLKKYVDVDLFLDHGVEPNSEKIRSNFKYYSYKQFPRLASEKKYDAILYHVGNNTMHRYIYETLLEFPGITVLHDYVLHPFIQHITLLNGNSKGYADELIGSYGNEGKTLADSYLMGIHCPIDFLKYPLNERIVKASTRIVVHSQYVKGMLNADGKVRLIQHGRDPVDISPDVIEQNKQRLNLGGKWPVIGCFGFMNRNKRIPVLIEAFGRIVSDHPEAILLLVGDIDRQLKAEIGGQISDLGIGDNVVFTGFAAHDEYQRYLSCTDVVVNLRHPTMGETSGTQLDALAFGKPLIVSNVGSYLEVPDSCCWKVDVDATEVDLLYAYLAKLLLFEKLRTIMGQNARRYIVQNHEWDFVVLDYVKLILGEQKMDREA